MGLFTFFKPRPNPKPDVKYSDAVQALHAGILFEDSGEFMGWDVPIEENQLYVKKGYRADRTIYEWGDRVILNGLKLPLSTILWKHKDDGKDVPAIEFSAVKEDAEKYFELISAHLKKTFGPPKTIDEESGKLLEWKVGIVKVTLHLYEQYHTDKLLFQIGRL
jgi:hypothetical protein